jgi:ATP-binding cassette subfamily C protein LapB
MDLIGSQPQGLALPITEGGRGVSGGQRQLIALTRLALASPRVWLLDEPTGAMDAVTEARILQLLQELGNQGHSLLVATHKSALIPLFDRLIVLQNGRIAIDGPREAVIVHLSAPQRTATVAPVAAAVREVAA